MLAPVVQHQSQESQGRASGTVSPARGRGGPFSKPSSCLTLQKGHWDPGP